jgi:SAM-dependent methyltransferase
MKTLEGDDERDILLDGWQEAAQGWGRQADGVRDAAMPVSIWMLDHADLQPGQTVLELAAGPGDTGFMAAERIKPGGKLISSDAVAAMLDVARERAQELGVDNVEFTQLQLEWIDQPTASVDVVLVKWALMLLLDPGAALRECRRVLKPGGRLVIAVWDAAERNPWATIPQRALVELGHVEPPAPGGGPGMFALADPAVIGELLDDAGLFDVELEAIEMPRSYSSVTAWIGETIDLSRGFKSVWAQLADEQRRELRSRIEELARGFTAADGALTLPAASLGVVAGA